MGKALNTVIWILVFFIVGVILGMVSPGQWLEDRSWEIRGLYHRIRFGNVPIAENFVTAPFALKLAYVQNTSTGALETYLQNTATNEMLPIYEINGVTQVGDFDHRLDGIRFQAQSRIEEGGGAVLDKLKQLKDLF
jgi:hypothetical protein